MFSPTRTALYIAIGAMALTANEASAGCKILSTGVKYCASWIVGSEVCQVTIDTGVSGISPGDVDVTCTIDGAEGFGGGGGAPFCAEGPLTGTLVCGTPGGGEFPTFASSSATTADIDALKAHKAKKPKKPKKKHNHENDCGGPCPVVEESYPLEDSSNVPITTLTEPALVTSCDAKGTCKATAELNPDPSVCDAFGESFVDFTADDFIATVNVSIQTIPEPTLYQYCQLNGNKYDCTDLTYNPFSDYPCGGGS
jgi:hypothetical protein